MEKASGKSQYIGIFNGGNLQKRTYRLLNQNITNEALSAYFVFQELFCRF